MEGKVNIEGGFLIQVPVFEWVLVSFSKRKNNEKEWGIKDNGFYVGHGLWNASWKVGL